MNGIGETCESPDLSVVVCSMGRAGVEETLDSIAGSTRAAGAAVETVLVWQASDPPPQSLCVHVSHAFPAGLGLARNRGLRAIRGPLVGFVDDDELVDPGWVSGVISAFPATRPVEAVFGPVRPRDERGLAFCNFEGGEPQVFTDPSTPPWLVGTGGNMAFRTAAILEAGGFDTAFGVGAIARSAEDSEIIVRFLKQGRTIAWSPDMVVYHPTKTEPERLASRYPYAYGLGKVVRRHRDPMLSARHMRATSTVLATAARRRDGRRWREGTATLQGFLAGVALRARALSPVAALERMPESLPARLRENTLDPQRQGFGPDPHYMYRAGPDLLLHLYVNPSNRLAASVAARKVIAAKSAVGGIPALHAVERGTDALWVLEDWLEGRHPRARDAQRWFPHAARWAIDMGGVGGPRVALRDGWNEWTERLLSASPQGLRDVLRRALQIVGELPSRYVHGDFQRKNLLVTGRGGMRAIGVIDWEHAEEEGLPGFDLTFLAVMARRDTPDPSAIVALAQGGDLSWAPVRPWLHRAGLSDDVLRPALLVILAEWAAREDERVATPGFPSKERPFRALLLACAPYLS